jgi:hypothetical protein
MEIDGPWRGEGRKAPSGRQGRTGDSAALCRELRRSEAGQALTEPVVPCNRRGHEGAEAAGARDGDGRNGQLPLPPEGRLRESQELQVSLGRRGERHLPAEYAGAQGLPQDPPDHRVRLPRRQGQRRRMLQARRPGRRQVSGPPLLRPQPAESLSLPP